MQGVFVSRQHSLGLPAEVVNIIAVKVFSLLYDRSCEVCQRVISERGVSNFGWSDRPEGCICEHEGEQWPPLLDVNQDGIQSNSPT